MVKTNLYFESHVTLKPINDESAERLADIAKVHGFRVAKFLMKKGETLMPDDFMTARSKDFEDILHKTTSVVVALQAEGFKVTRYKIEDTLVDIWV